jgi:hypothetical protein
MDSLLRRNGTLNLVSCTVAFSSHALERSVEATQYRPLTIGAKDRQRVHYLLVQLTLHIPKFAILLDQGLALLHRAAELLVKSNIR